LPETSSSSNFVCKSWNLSEPFWTGKLKVHLKGNLIKISFVEKNNVNIFAQSETLDLEKTKEEELANFLRPVTDSSRYFVIDVKEPESDRKMTIGFGFKSRSESFDLNECLQRQLKIAKRKNESTSEEDFMAMLEARNKDSGRFSRT
ncbi:Adaptin ear-binding coat-associated protein 1, partial [Bonamia ostreae]